MQATLTSSYQERLGTIIADVVGPQAEAIDRQAVFPGQGVAALAESGLLGLISAREVGGSGFGLAEAADMIEDAFRISSQVPEERELILEVVG